MRLVTAFLLTMPMTFSARFALQMKKDTAPRVRTLYHYTKPRGTNQEKYINFLKDDETKMIFAVGPAGTGKTMFACEAAIRGLKNGSIGKVVITRPVVPVEEDIGFLPGNINKKMDPWTRPVFDIFLDFFNQKEIDIMVYNGVIEIAPLAYMRGRTFKKAFIIADEMQNSSPNQMMMLTTRIGEGSKMVITGDLKQSDKGHGSSGLQDFLERFGSYNGSAQGIEVVKFETQDVERSDIVVKMLDIYNNKPNEPKTTEEHSKPEPKNFTTTEFFMTTPYYNDAALLPKSEIPKRLR